MRIFEAQQPDDNGGRSIKDGKKGAVPALKNKTTPKSSNRKEVDKNLY